MPDQYSIADRTPYRFLREIGAVSEQRLQLQLMGLAVRSREVS